VTSLIVKLWEVAWDLWDHRNQIKFNLEMAQDLAQKESILLAVCSEYAFGRSGLPRRDWRQFRRPLLSLLDSSMHYLDAWLVHVVNARARQARRIADNIDEIVNTAEDNLPSMAGPCRLFQQFLGPVSQT
jgi:hypothetical protein